MPLGVSEHEGFTVIVGLTTYCYFASVHRHHRRAVGVQFLDQVWPTHVEV